MDTPNPWFLELRKVQGGEFKVVPSKKILHGASSGCTILFYVCVKPVLWNISKSITQEREKKINWFRSTIFKQE